MDILKKALIGLGALVGLVVLVALGSYLAVGKGLDEEAKNAAQDIFKAVAADWSIDAVNKVADEGLHQAVTRKQLLKYLNWFKDKLGPLESIQDCRGEAKLFYNLGSGSTTTADYEIQARFKKGKGRVVIKLKKNDKQWKLLGLNVYSNLLIPIE